MNEQNIFFTSDSHFFHNNILAHEPHRPYENLDDMHEGLIKVWNDTVNKDSTIYHLGDFVFGGISRWKEILSQLKGEIVLVKGNHDDGKVVRKLYEEGYFKVYHEVGCYFKHRKNQFWLTHYPMNIGYRPRLFSISGHVHSTPSTSENIINVGVDSPLNFNRPFGKPISLEEIMTYVEYINPILEENKLRSNGIIL